MGTSGVDVAPVPVQPDDSKKPRRFSGGAPRSTFGRQQERLGWMLVFPSVLVVVLVAIYPLLMSFYYSTTNYRLTRPDRIENVGLDNYRQLFTDSVFITSLWNTTVFTVVAVTLETLLGMIIALTIHSSFKGRGIVRTSMLVPWAIPTVVSSLLWGWMLHDRYGVINEIFMFLRIDVLLERLGIVDDFTNFDWAGNTSTALGSVIAVDVWKTTPFMALLLLAGLQVIPDDVYEASRVDGGSKWQQFWDITLPLLRPALLVALIFRTMATFRVFDMIYVLKGYATETMSVAVYTHREVVASQKVGYGSAAAVVIFLIIGLMVIGYTRLIRVEEG
jgi:trehalose/maltose transport system permease protein